MLRASVIAMSVATLTAFVAVPLALAGPYHHPHHARAMPRVMTAAPGAAAARPARPVVRPAAPVKPVFDSFLPPPLFPFYGAGRTIIVGNGAAAPAPSSVTVTINPAPVVVGIRRAPEAAPVIYRVADGREARRQWQERRRMAPSAGVRHLEPDTTTPRIVIVRGGH